MFSAQASTINPNAFSIKMGTGVGSSQAKYGAQRMGIQSKGQFGNANTSQSVFLGSKNQREILLKASNVKYSGHDFSIDTSQPVKIFEQNPNLRKLMEQDTLQGLKQQEKMTSINQPLKPLIDWTSKLNQPVPQVQSNNFVLQPDFIERSDLFYGPNFETVTSQSNTEYSSTIRKYNKTFRSNNFKMRALPSDKDDMYCFPLEMCALPEFQVEKENSIDEDQPWFDRLSTFMDQEFEQYSGEEKNNYNMIAQELKMKQRESNQGKQAKSIVDNSIDEDQPWFDRLSTQKVRALPSNKEDFKILSQMMTVAYWRTQMKEIVDGETLLTELNVDAQFDLMSDESDQFGIKMKSLSEHNRGGEYMSKQDLQLVKECMALDLTKVINWDKSALASQVHGGPTPYHFKAFNDQYWRQIASQVWQWPSISTGHNSLHITFDMDYFENSIDQGKKLSDVQLGYGKDISVIRKLSFIAHNFYELKLAQEKSSGDILKYPGAYEEINYLSDGLPQNNNIIQQDSKSKTMEKNYITSMNSKYKGAFEDQLEKVIFEKVRVLPSDKEDMYVFEGESCKLPEFQVEKENSIDQDTMPYGLKVYYNDQISVEQRAKLLLRPEINFEKVFDQVKPIIEYVQEYGDGGIRYYTNKFDKVDIPEEKTVMNVKDLDAPEITAEEKLAFDTAYDNITKFHRAQVKEGISVETMPGVKCRREVRAIQKVGLYVPGGTAVLPSTALMLGVPAQIAGCKTVVLATPPRKDGSICPQVIYCAKKCGIDKILVAGGAQAIAALAYGTETCPKVDKICGPGNQFVTAAKMILQNEGNAMVAIDMPAGPSEQLCIADKTSKIPFVVADLLSQSEHGQDSQVVGVFIESETIDLEEYKKEFERQVENLERKDIVKAALSKSFILVVKSKTEAMEFSNQYSPEHLVIQTDDAEEYVELVENAGSLFLGHYTPESVGDYASGTNHSLPTYGYANMYSGVSYDTFVKHITVQNLTPLGLRNVGSCVETMASVEGLGAHKNAVTIRLKDIEENFTEEDLKKTQSKEYNGQINANAVCDLDDVECLKSFDEQQLLYTSLP